MFTKATVAALAVGASFVEGGPSRGVGLAYWSCDDAEALDVEWFYNWQPSHPCEDQTSIPWIPMIWGEDDVQYCEFLKGSNYDALLSFNEPNADNQADMTVAQAIDAWPSLMDTGLRLGAPCVTQWGAFSWQKEFMGNISEKGYTVDFLCFHWYGYEGMSTSELYDYLSDIKSTYPGYTIWLTEFANATGDSGDNINLFQDAYNWINDDFSDLVERYAWFTNRQQNDVQGWDLINWDNGQPTDLGNVYKDSSNWKLTDNKKNDKLKQKQQNNSNKQKNKQNNKNNNKRSKLFKHNKHGN